LAPPCGLLTLASDGHFDGLTSCRVAPLLC